MSIKGSFRKHDTILQGIYDAIRWILSRGQKVINYILAISVTVNVTGAFSVFLIAFTFPLPFAYTLPIFNAYGTHRAS